MGMTFAATDAADQVTTPAASRLNTLSAWSVEMLFKTTSAGGNNYIYTEADNQATGFPFLTVGTHNGRAIFQYRGTSAAIQIYPSTMRNTGVWFHMVAVKRTISDWELYINGASVGTTTAASDAGTFENSFIGRLQQGAGAANWFDGSIGFVRTYAVALSVDQIKILNANRGATPPVTPRAAWMLDEGPSGTNASTSAGAITDVSANAYHGTAAGTPVYLPTPTTNIIPPGS